MRPSAAGEEAIFENRHEIRVCQVQTEIDFRKNVTKRTYFVRTKPVTPALFDDLRKGTPTFPGHAAGGRKLNHPVFVWTLAVRLFRGRTQFDVAPTPHSVEIG